MIALSHLDSKVRCRRHEKLMEQSVVCRMAELAGDPDKLASAMRLAERLLDPPRHSRS
jgi:hypothetical protein